MKICKVKGCKKKHWARGYCRTHISMFYRRGEIPNKTRLDPNDIYVQGEILILVLRDTLGKKVGESMTDLSDINLIKKHKWHLNNSGYAVTRINKSRQESLHRILMKPGKDESVDHINGNTLDNRRTNLRVCTHQENMFNSKIRTNNTSGVTGVAFDKKRNRWRARIHVDARDLHLGYFKTMEEAIEIRSEAEEKYFGEFRRIEVQ